MCIISPNVRLILFLHTLLPSRDSLVCSEALDYLASIPSEAGTRPASLSTVETSSFFFSSRRRHTRFKCDWSSDVCSSDLRDTSVVARLKVMMKSAAFAVAGCLVAIGTARADETTEVSRSAPDTRGSLYNAFELGIATGYTQGVGDVGDGVRSLTDSGGPGLAAVVVSRVAI